jgi:hypothetical protein
MAKVSNTDYGMNGYCNGCAKTATCWGGDNQKPCMDYIRVRERRIKQEVSNGAQDAYSQSVAPMSKINGMRRFTMFRKLDISATHDSNQVNPPDLPQFEGVVFSDGKVAIRWLTAKRSVAVWDSMEDMLSIHGHPEYGSILVWNDEAQLAHDQH